MPEIVDGIKITKISSENIRYFKCYADKNTPGSKMSITLKVGIEQPENLVCGF